MGYSENEAMVRVDFFKPGGKWYCTEAVDFTGFYNEKFVQEALAFALKRHLWVEGRIRLGSMVAVCLEPCHHMAFPLFTGETVEEYINRYSPIRNLDNE